MGNSVSGCACGKSRDSGGEHGPLSKDFKSRFQGEEIDRIIEDAYFSSTEMQVFGPEDGTWTSAKARAFFEEEDEEEGDEAWREQYIRAGILERDGGDDDSGGEGEGGEEDEVGAHELRGLTKDGTVTGPLAEDVPFPGEPSPDLPQAAGSDDTSEGPRRRQVMFAADVEGGGEYGVDGEDDDRRKFTVDDFAEGVKSIPERTARGLSDLRADIVKLPARTADGLKAVPVKLKQAGEATRDGFTSAGRRIRRTLTTTSNAFVSIMKVRTQLDERDEHTIPSAMRDDLLRQEAVTTCSKANGWERIAICKPSNKADRGYTGSYVQPVASGMPQDATYKVDHVFMGVPPEDLSRLLLDTDLRATWDRPYADGARVVEQITANSSVVYTLFKQRNWALKQMAGQFDFLDKQRVFRDALLMGEAPGDGTVAAPIEPEMPEDMVTAMRALNPTVSLRPAATATVLAQISTEHPDCPPARGYTRGRSLAGTGWVIRRWIPVGMSEDDLRDDPYHPECATRLTLLSSMDMGSSKLAKMGAGMIKKVVYANAKKGAIDWRNTLYVGYTKLREQNPAWTKLREGKTV